MVGMVDGKSDVLCCTLCTKKAYHVDSRKIISGITRHHNAALLFYLFQKCLLIITEQRHVLQYHDILLVQAYTSFPHIMKLVINDHGTDHKRSRNCKLHNDKQTSDSFAL